MNTALALALAWVPLAQDGPYVTTMLDGFESLAVEYAQGGAILRTWLGEQDELRESFRITNLQPPSDLPFQPTLLLGWPVAWTFYFAGGLGEEAWIAGPNQLSHPEVGRITLDPKFMDVLQTRLTSQSSAAVALRMENPLPAEQADLMTKAVAKLGSSWDAARVEYRGREADLRVGLEDLKLERLVFTGSSGPLPDGGGRIVLLGEEGHELVLRLLQASRSSTRVFNHTWLHMQGIGALWVPNEWMLRLQPELPCLQPPPRGETLDELLGMLNNPIRMASELQRLLVETRPLEGEFGPPRLAVRDAPLARLPTRIWALLRFEPLVWSEARWRRRILDWERRGAARIHLWGKGSGPWNMGLIPTSDTSALVPFVGRVEFETPAWSDLIRLAASDLELDDSNSLRIAPR